MCQPGIEPPLNFANCVTHEVSTVLTAIYFQARQDYIVLKYSDLCNNEAIERKGGKIVEKKKYVAVAHQRVFYCHKNKKLGPTEI